MTHRAPMVLHAVDRIPEMLAESKMESSMSRIIDLTARGPRTATGSASAQAGAGFDPFKSESLASAGRQRGLTFTPQIAEATAHHYERVRDVVPPVEWPAMAPFIHAIETLKRERDAVVLAHNYMTPDIFACISDIRGDSLQLAREAARTTARTIVQAGVHFMAETSKMLNMDKTVLLPDLRAGCSLAASITARDVALIKDAYPGIPVVTYVNTCAQVKAQSDVCCTSSNAVQVCEWAANHWGTDTVILLPDEFLAKNVATMTKLNIISWRGRCEVHENFSIKDIAEIRESYPGALILAHPECPPDVVAAADYAGSTSALASFVQERQPRQVVLLTECSMSDNVAIENPTVDFIRPCNLCRHMKAISLASIYDALVHMRHEITLSEDVAQRGRTAIERMLSLPQHTARTDFAVGQPAASVRVI
jgi:quinolinate synthase